MSQSTAARVGFAALVPAALLAIAAVLGVRLGLFPYTLGWQMMFPAAGLGLVALGFALVWLVKALGANNGAGRSPGVFALAGSLLILYPAVTTYAHRLLLPAMHDFTSDTENPPQFVALAKARAPSANPPAYDGKVVVHFDGKDLMLDEVLHQHYSDILKPHAGFAVGSKNPIATFFKRDMDMARKTGWTIVDANEAEGRIEATHASPWFGRVSDIVIQVRRAGAGARTDLRSQSRDDAIDDGFNAANAKSYFYILTH